MSESVKNKTKIRRIWTLSTSKASARKESEENVPAVTKKVPTQLDSDLLGSLLPLADYWGLDFRELHPSSGYLRAFSPLCSENVET